MTGPSIEPVGPLKVALVARLLGDASLQAMLGANGDGSVYDEVPVDQAGRPTKTFPYISLGTISFDDDSSVCIESGLTTIELMIWSRGTGGRAEAMAIGNAATVALHSSRPLAPAGHTVTLQYRESAQYYPDRDGLTSIGRLVFKFETDAFARA